MEYDLIRLLEHPLRFRRCMSYAIALLGGNRNEGRIEIEVSWRTSASDKIADDTLTLSWNVDAIRPHYGEIDEELQILRTRDDDQATWVEETAVVIAVAVMAHVEPGTRFTRRSMTGTGHDYYLNETRDEVIEIAGRWKGGLDTLFEEKRQQSDTNPSLRKRWVSVTIMRKHPRNRTEGLHT